MIKKLLFPRYQLAAYALVIAALSSLLVPFNIAFAAAGYQDDYQTTDALWIDDYKNYWGNTCQPTNITNSYATYLLDSSKWLAADGHAPAHSTLQAEKESFLRALDGGSWAVSVTNDYYPDGGSGINRVSLGWTENKSMALRFNSGGSVTADANGGTFHVIEIAVDDNHNFGCRLGINSAQSGTNAYMNISNDKDFTQLPDSITSTNDDATRNLFANVDNVTYPTGYTGKMVKKSFSDSAYDWFKYRVDVDDRNITVTPDTEAITAGCINWNTKLFWKSATSYTDSAQIMDRDDNLAKTEVSKLTAPDHADFVILIDATIPMMCNNPDQYESPFLKSVNVKIDGSAYSVASTDLDCIGDICYTPSPFEDCATYGTDLVAGFACVMRNFMVSLRVMFATLLVPSPHRSRDLLEGFSSTLVEKLGFLSFPFTFLNDVYASFTSNAAWCSSSNCKLELDVMNNGHMTFDLLYFKNSDFAPAWDFGVAFIRATTILGVVYLVQRKWTELLSR